jgi:hypothetical protein
MLMLTPRLPGPPRKVSNPKVALRFALLCWLAVVGLAAEPSVDFIHLTDTHVATLQRSNGTADRLSGFLETLSGPEGGAYRPAFFLISGDLVDAFQYAAGPGPALYGQVEAFRDAAAHSAVPVHLALGNHDIIRIRGAGQRAVAETWVAREARAAWTHAAACFHSGTWYQFRQQAGAVPYVFLVLDNGDPVGHTQLEWLRQAAGSLSGVRIILVTHVPLDQEPAAAAIRAALADSDVWLALAGHTHHDLVRPIELGRGKPLEVRTAAFVLATSNWRRLRLFPDRIEVFRTGDPDRVEAVVKP